MAKIFKIVLVAVLGFTAVIIFSNYPKQKLNKNIIKLIDVHKNSKKEITAIQQEAIFLLLGYKFNEPLIYGEKIFKTKKSMVYGKKEIGYFSFDKLYGKNKANMKEFNNFFNENPALKNNLDKIILTFSKVSEIIPTIPASFVSEHHLNTDIFKFSKDYYVLLNYLYLRDKNTKYLGKHYLNLHKMALNVDGAMITTMLNTSSFKSLHNFIVKNKIKVNTENKKEELISNYNSSKYKRIKKNGMIYTILSYYPSISNSKFYYDDMKQTLNLIGRSDLGVLKKIKLGMFNVFFDINNNFNRELEFITKYGDECLEDALVCLKRIENDTSHISLSNPIGKKYYLSSLESFLSNLNKHRITLEKIL